MNASSLLWKMEGSGLWERTGDSPTKSSLEKWGWKLELALAWIRWGGEGQGTVVCH